MDLDIEIIFRLVAVAIGVAVAVTALWGLLNMLRRPYCYTQYHHKIRHQDSPCFTCPCRGNCRADSEW